MPYMALLPIKFYYVSDCPVVLSYLLKRNKLYVIKVLIVNLEHLTYNINKGFASNPPSELHVIFYVLYINSHIESYC